MNPYDILALCQNRPKQNTQPLNQDISSKLYQILLQRYIQNHNLINQYLRNIAKKERKLKNISSQEKPLIFSTPKKVNDPELINEGVSYSSQEQIIAPKQNYQKKSENPQTKLTSIIRHTRQYKRVRNIPNTRSFLQPISPTPLPNFFSIVTPTQPLHTQKVADRKETVANQLRKLLLKEVYSLHHNMNKPIDFEPENENQNPLEPQQFWIQKHLNIKKMGLQASRNVRKIKTDSAQPATSSDIKHSLRGSECKQRGAQVGKNLPKVNASSHLQRNKRCLEMFLKFTTHKKKHTPSLIRSCKTQSEDVTSIKRFKINTVPLKKQI